MFIGVIIGGSLLFLWYMIKFIFMLYKIMFMGIKEAIK